MGRFTKGKAAAGVNDAQKASDGGATSFLARYWDEVLSFQGTGVVAGAGEFIADVEAIGWRVEHMSYAWVPEKRRGVTILLFRR